MNALKAHSPAANDITARILKDAPPTPPKPPTISEILAAVTSILRRQDEMALRLAEALREARR